MSASALNAFHNLWVLSLIRQNSSLSSFTITARNHPLPRSADTEVSVLSGALVGSVTLNYEHGGEGGGRGGGGGGVHYSGTDRIVLP